MDIVCIPMPDVEMGACFFGFASQSRTGFPDGCCLVTSDKRVLRAFSETAVSMQDFIA